MHNMTRDAARAKVRGPFDGSTFSFKGDSARLETVGGERFMTIASRRYGSGVYRITKIIGGHHREDYVGVPVDGARPGARRAGDEEVVLPVSFVYATNALRYKGYSVMVKERDGLRAGPVWGETCIFCHNTAPYLSTVLGALAGKGAKPYQGEVVDPLLPPDRRARYVVTDEDALERELGEEVARLGAPRDGAIDPRAAIAVTRSRFRERQLVELGIGCEACHLGAAEHVADPKKLPTFVPRSDAFAVRWPETAEPRASRVNRTCARCHQVLFSGYDHTWEGGGRHTNPGGSNINSGEGRDLLMGACASKLTCVECHDPHAPEASGALRTLSVAQGNALCTRCHEAYAEPAALRAHAHHDPAGAGGACLGCHMPRKNMTLDGGLGRYHRIGSPTDAPRVMLDRPLECALCHADATVGSLVGAMEKWWKRAYDRDALVKLYGSLDANVLLATAERGKPHEQAVAFQILGEKKVKAAVPILAAQLTHPYPLVRGYAKRALDAIAGAQVPVDIDADPAAIRAAATAWLATAPR
jgi:predicted CXXCH cytochrome family protein